MMLFDTFAELDRLGSTLLSGLSGSGMHAPVNLRREDDRYVLEADLPGVDPNAIDITVDDVWLTIRAERSSESERGDARWLIRERSSATAVRRLALGQDIDVDAIEASYDAGVLRLTLPLREDARSKRIAVAVGGAPARAAIGTNSAASGAAAEREAAEGKAQPAHSLAS